MSKRNNPTLQKQALLVVDRVAHETNRRPDQVEINGGIQFIEGRPVFRWRVTVEMVRNVPGESQCRARGEGEELDDAATNCIAHERRCVDSGYAKPGLVGAA